MCSTRIGSTTNAVATFTVAKSVPPHFVMPSDLGDVDGVEGGGVARVAALRLAPAQFGEKAGAPGAGGDRGQSAAQLDAGVGGEFSNEQGVIGNALAQIAEGHQAWWLDTGAVS